MKYLKRRKMPALLVNAALSALLLAGCEREPQASVVQQNPTPATAAPFAAKEPVELVHVHGLAYTPDGEKLLIPSHFGLAVFDGDSWSKAPGAQHDYMGFSATQDAIYSSGHPARDSGLVNPFGVIKSSDGGQTWQKLGFEGESDFHWLATGYETNAIYVLNLHANSKMKEPGIYYTLNDGFSWERTAGQGLDGMPASIVVHPSEPKIIAAGTKGGLFLSRDAGNTFRRIRGGQTTAALFDLDGKHLWVGSVATAAELTRIDLDGNGEVRIDLPEMDKDAIAYIAQNPVKRNEYAIATFNRSVYLSSDAGQTWKQIADNSKTM